MMKRCTGGIGEEYSCPRNGVGEESIKAIISPKKIRLYLSHPNESRFEIREWELEFEKRTGIKIINPFYDGDRFNEDELRNEVEITHDSSPNGKKYMRFKPMNPRKLVEVDIRDVLMSDGSITVLNEHPGSQEESYGTIQEMVYGRLFQKKIFALITNGYEKHPWLVYHSSEIFTSIEGLEKGVIDWALEF